MMRGDGQLLDNPVLFPRTGAKIGGRISLGLSCRRLVLSVGGPEFFIYLWLAYDGTLARVHGWMDGLMGILYECVECQQLYLSGKGRMDGRKEWGKMVWIDGRMGGWMERARARCIEWGFCLIAFFAFLFSVWA